MTAERDTVEGALAAFWDRETDGVWEPVRFEVGQRVAIHRSAECPHVYDFMHAEHLPDGAIGTVMTTMPLMFGEQTSDGHDIIVKFGEDAEGRADCSWFAPSELVPLADEPAARADEGEGS